MISICAISLGSIDGELVVGDGAGKLEHEKWTHMLKMVERHVLVFLLSNKTVVQTHVLLVIVPF